MRGLRLIVEPLDSSSVLGTRMPEEHGNLAELPQQVCEGIVRDISNFAVAIFGISKTRNNETLTFCGSGTLVSSDKAYYVLTAAHVWTKKIHSSEQMALTLLEDGFHSYRIETRLVIVDAIFGPDESEEWVPIFASFAYPARLLEQSKRIGAFTISISAGMSLSIPL